MLANYHYDHRRHPTLHLCRSYELLKAQSLTTTKSMRKLQPTKTLRLRFTAQKLRCAVDKLGTRAAGVHLLPTSTRSKNKLWTPTATNLSGPGRSSSPKSCNKLELRKLAQHYFRCTSALQQKPRPQQRTDTNMQVKRTLGINQIQFLKASRNVHREKTYIETPHSRLSACLLLDSLLNYRQRAAVGGW